MWSTRVLRRHQTPKESIAIPFESLDSANRENCHCCLSQTCVKSVKPPNVIIVRTPKSKFRPETSIETPSIVSRIEQRPLSITQTVRQQRQKDKKHPSRPKTNNGAETYAIYACFVGRLRLQRTGIQRPIDVEDLVHRPRGIRTAILKPAPPGPIYDAIRYIAQPEFKLQHIHATEYLTPDPTVFLTASLSPAKITVQPTAATAIPAASAPIPIPYPTKRTRIITMAGAGPSRERSAEHLENAPNVRNPKAPNSDREWPDNSSTPPRSPYMYPIKAEKEYEEAHKIARGEANANANGQADANAALCTNGVIVHDDGSETPMPKGWRTGSKGTQRALARARLHAPLANTGSWETTNSALPLEGPSTRGQAVRQRQITYERTDCQGAAGPSNTTTTARPPARTTAPRRPAPQTRPSIPGHATLYQIWVGIANETTEKNGHFVLVLRAPPHLAHPNGDCTWYHVLGWGLEETNYFRRVIHCPRLFDEPFFNRKLPVGMMPEYKMRLFQHAFRSTPPQPPEFFLIHFLRKLVAAQIVSPWQILDFERMIGEPPAELADDPDFKPSPEYGPTWSRGLDVEGNVPIFEMEMDK
ncbi:hypothetical protein BDW74DRAFT_183077 [Aspergillus multicolor]|uniref:uncharacterized protein n=1 Tax=Aspergillus multicolor TaxID=41759 RepID=UPI003CCD7F77